MKKSWKWNCRYVSKTNSRERQYKPVALLDYCSFTSFVSKMTSSICFSRKQSFSSFRIENIHHEAIPYHHGEIPHTQKRKFAPPSQKCKKKRLENGDEKPPLSVFELTSQKTFVTVPLIKIHMSIWINFNADTVQTCQLTV